MWIDNLTADRKKLVYIFGTQAACRQGKFGERGHHREKGGLQMRRIGLHEPIGAIDNKELAVKMVRELVAIFLFN